VSRYRRGFGSQLECLFPIGLLAIVLVLAFPMLRAAKYATRHGADPWIAFARVFSFEVAIVFLVPLIVAVPWAVITSPSRNRRQRFGDIVGEYWVKAFAAVVGLVVLTVFCSSCGRDYVSPLVTRDLSQK